MYMNCVGIAEEKGNEMITVQLLQQCIAGGYV